MGSYQNDFTYYYYQSGSIQAAAKCSEVPEDVESFVKIQNAVSFVQKLGCAGISQHKVNEEHHALCLDVLRIAVEKYGEVFPVLLRGVRSQRPDCDHKILFGTTDYSVAAEYGEVKEYRNVKGLRTRSTALSVVTGDYDQMDEEIIFFPE